MLASSSAMSTTSFVVSISSHHRCHSGRIWSILADNSFVLIKRGEGVSECY